VGPRRPTPQTIRMAEMKILDKFFEPNQAVTLILSGLIGMLIQASFDNTYDYKVQGRWYLILLGFPV